MRMILFVLTLTCAQVLLADKVQNDAIVAVDQLVIEKRRRRFMFEVISHAAFSATLSGMALIWFKDMLEPSRNGR